MAEMSDHDRIEEIQAYIRGILVAVKALLDALEVVAAGNPERSEALHPLIMNAWFVLAASEDQASWRRSPLGRAVRAAQEAAATPEREP